MVGKGRRGKHATWWVLAVALLCVVVTVSRLLTTIVRMEDQRYVNLDMDEPDEDGGSTMLTDEKVEDAAAGPGPGSEAAAPGNSGGSAVLTWKGKQKSRGPNCFALMNTRKFNAACHDSPTRRLLITGIGGSGTHTMTQLLVQLGLSFRHEQLGDDGSVSWPYAVSSEYECFRAHKELKCNGLYPWRSPAHKMTTRFELVFHQTRCPMDNIGALTSHAPQSYNFISPMVGVRLWREEPLIRAAMAYIAWNRHIEEYADYRFQMETANVTDLCLRAFAYQHRELCFRDNKAANIARANKREHGSYTLSDLRQANATLAAQVEQLAIKYGYESCKEDCDCDLPRVAPYVTKAAAGIGRR